MDTIKNRFINYLHSLGLTDISLTNYVSDLNVFITYLTNKIAELGSFPQNLTEAIPFLDDYLTQNYKHHLITMANPPRTINRRLTTVRILGKFLESERILNSNFAVNLANVPVPYEISPQTLTDFGQYLAKLGASNSTVNNYLVDLRHFLEWLSQNPGLTVCLNITSNTINDYLNTTATGFSEAYTKRKISAIRKLFDFLLSTGKVARNPVTDYLVRQGKITLPQEDKPNRLHFKRFNLNTIKSNLNLSTVFYFQLATVSVLVIILGYGLYHNFFVKPQTPLATLPVISSPASGTKEVAFQGSLANTDGATVISPTVATFRLYDADVEGNSLWDSGGCEIIPDENGLFSLNLGSDCGQPIEASTFSENPEIYLGITVENETESSPRIPIAQVSRASSALTLNGFEASSSATINHIPVINELGELVLASDLPKIKSASDSAGLVLEGRGGVTLASTDTSNASININPDGNGSLNLFFEGDLPMGNGFVNAFGTNLASGALYFGEVASDASSYNLIELRSGSVPTQKFTVDAGGNTRIAGDVTVKSLASLSDARLKHNINSINDALAKVTKLRGVTFNWTDDPANKPATGLIAQEVAQVAPELVETDPQTGLQSVRYGEAVGLLVEAVKEIAQKQEEPKNQQLEEMEALLKQAEADQALLADSRNWNNNPTVTNQLETMELYVTDQAAINNLSLTNSLAIGTDLTISVNTTDSSVALNSLSSPLRLQSLALAPIEMMDGLVKITTTGDVEITGSLKTKGQVTAGSLSVTDLEGKETALINASGSARLKAVITNNFFIASNTPDETVNEFGEVNSNAIAGTAVLPAHFTEITLHNPYLSDTSLVYVSPTSSTANKVLYVKSKDQGMAKIGFQDSSETDVTFNWWIIDRASD